MSVCVQNSGVNMASQEEDNKLECISNVNKEQERYYLNVYKKYDSILNDKSESFENKVTSLIEVWSSISELNLSQFDIRYVIQIIDWAKLHALNIVLTGEWRSTKESFRNSLLESIEKAQSSLATVNEAFSSRCQKLADVVKKPWEDPVLANLIQEKDVEIGSKEIEFFCVETAYLVSVRLKKLCENHCEDLALNLVTNFLNYKKLATVKNFNLNATETQLWFIFDIYIALLYKFQDKAKILEQFEELQLVEGVMLIKRFAKKRVKISKIWRNCHKIAVFGSRFFMSRALMKYTDEYKDFLTELLKTYLALSNTDTLLQEFVLSVRNITNLADAAGLCVMCEVIHREAADRLRVFAIEMYIRALTTDMNELERLKHVNEEDKVKLTTSRLAKTFTNLADLLDDHVKVARECILTAFSLEPTKDRLKRIEDLAKRSGFPVLDTGQEWKCRLHPPVLPSDDLAWVCPECGEWMCKPELTAPLQMNMALHEALQESVLGISEALCDDLVVCLSNPRYQILSWLLAWGDLYRLCILYLNDPEKTKNFVTELKFVDVDYSMFEHIKREPVDEYTGIEKGYEQYLDLDFVSDEETSSVSEDSMSHDRSVGLGSDGAGEPYLPLPQPKSDPVTLKSLRMFRPNLKRKKEDPDLPTTDKKASMLADGISSASSASSLGSYLSSTHYNLQSDYPTNSTVGSRLYATLSSPNKTSSSSAYLSQAAGVTKQSTTSNLSHISAASNFSAFGYSSIYAAKSFEVPKQPVTHSRNNFDQVNSRIQTSLNCSSNLLKARNAAHVSLSANTTLQPEYSGFNTTNLSSASSTSYVSNIIKSTLSYGVPKVTVTGSTYSSAVPSETGTNSHTFDSLSIAKQGLFNTPKQASFSPSDISSQTNRPPQQSSFAATNVTSQKNLQAAFALNSLAFQKHPSQQVSDLDALLSDIDANKFETDSKNGVAATLLQLGGQVAKNQKQSIQVSQQTNLNQIPMKLPQETSLPNGTTEGCKKRLKSNTKLDRRKMPGEISDQMMEPPPCKRHKLTNGSNSPVKINLPGKTIFKMMQLQVRIPKLNMEQYTKQAVLDKIEQLPQTQKVFPIIQDDSITKPSETPAVPQKSQLKQLIPSKTQCPPGICRPEIKSLGQLTQCKPLPLSKPEHSTLLQDKLPSQTEVPVVQMHHQDKTSAGQVSPILTYQKEQSSMRPVLPRQETTIRSAARSQRVPEPQLKVVLNREHCRVPRRLEPVILIPPEKAKRIISQALLQQCQNSKPLLKEPVSELRSASINLVKNQECLEISSTSHNLLKAGVNSPSKVFSQFTDKKPASPKKLPTTCTPADSPKIITPIITDCDKDKKVQMDETTSTSHSLQKTGVDSSSKVFSQFTDKKPASPKKLPTTCPPTDSPKIITPIILGCEKDKKVQIDETTCTSHSLQKTGVDSPSKVFSQLINTKPTSPKKLPTTAPPTDSPKIAIPIIMVCDKDKTVELDEPTSKSHSLLKTEENSPSKVLNQLIDKKAASLKNLPITRTPADCLKIITPLITDCDKDHKVQMDDTISTSHSLRKDGVDRLSKVFSQLIDQKPTSPKNLPTTCTPAHSPQIISPIIMDCDKDNKAQMDETTRTSHSLLKTGVDNPSRVFSQLIHTKPASPKKLPTTCTPADSPKIIAPIIKGCDKDKKVKVDEPNSKSHSLIKTGVTSPSIVLNQLIDKKPASPKKLPTTCTSADSAKIITPIIMDCDKDRKGTMDETTSTSHSLLKTGVISSTKVFNQLTNKKADSPKITTPIIMDCDKDKKVQLDEATSTSGNLLKTGISQIISQFTDEKLAGPKKFPTTCKPADSSKVTPITMDCVKGKKVQMDIQKTDIEMTEIEDVAASTAEDNNNLCVSQVSFKKTNEQVSAVKDSTFILFKEIQKAIKTTFKPIVEQSSTQNINDSIIIDSEITSDNNIRIENKSNTGTLERNPDNAQHDSNNKEDNVTLTEHRKMTVNKTLKEDDQVKNDNKTVDIVHKNLDCDKIEANIVPINTEAKKLASREINPIEDEKSLQRVAQCNTKDEKLTTEKNKQHVTERDNEDINVLNDKHKTKVTDSKQNNRTLDANGVDTCKIVKTNKQTYSGKIPGSYLQSNRKNIIKKPAEEVDVENILDIASHNKDHVASTKELKGAPVYALDCEMQIAKNIDIVEDSRESNETIEIGATPTVNEIKENILQSIRNQEVIKSKTAGKKKCYKCMCKEDVRIKVGMKEPFQYVKYLHNYCGGPKVPPKASKTSTRRESSPTRPQLSFFQHKKPGENKSTFPRPRPSKLEVIADSDLATIDDDYVLFTDSYSETYFDLNKENIKISADDSTTDIQSSEELDNEDSAISNDVQPITPARDVNFDFSHFGTDKWAGFPENPINSICDRNTETNIFHRIKKYSNTHKTKHENVPCFKIDQEKNSHTKTHSSVTDNFEAKELSVVVKRLPHSMTNRVQRTSATDSIAILQQRLREKIRDNADAPICVLYKKDNQKSPLSSFNVRNQINKKKRIKKQKPDYNRNIIKDGGITKKKANLPKGGILKKKSDFPSKKPKKEKHVRFNLKNQVCYSEAAKEQSTAKSMLKNVPGLNDFSEVRPRNTQHVVNVVQVSGSRSSTVTNQNTQTSTQVTPHIQRIGQPKLPEQKTDRLEEKPEPSSSSSATTSKESLKPTSQATARVFGGPMKPGQKCSGTSRQTPLINILSQQILKQPGKPASNQNKPASNHNNNERPASNGSRRDRDQTATVKVKPEENAEAESSKSINTNIKILTSTSQAGGAAATATSTQGGTILQFICKSSSLPKFQQAFGKTVYQTNSSSEGATEAVEVPTSENLSQATTVVDTKKIATKTVPVNVQPITGNVIFRGQVPVGQTVSLIPPGSNTRQLFRITGSTHEQISLVKETVIQNKMSALLAAALQGKPKITEQNGELVEEYSATRITLCRPGTVPPNATRIVKPVQLQIPANVIRAPQPNLSSTTLEQLREFDMVYKQVKERSSNPAQPETTAQSSQESPQQQRISFTYVNQVQKYTQLSPVVVVSSYSPLQQTVSPALTATSQTSAGTCLTQVSTVAVPKVAVKTSKGKNIKSSATKTSPTAVPTIPKPQQKPQEDEHTTQRIFDILAEYAEQLRNSPDLNNKPAPRRRSNPPTNPSSSTSGSSSSKKKKKKSNSSTTSNLVETDNEDLTMGSEDSSGGNIVQLSMTDEEQSQSASITPPETNLEPATSNTSTPRPVIVTDASNQPRNVIIADSSVGEALKMPNTALIMPGSYIMPVSVVKGGQQIAVVSGGSKILTTVPARSGQNMLLFQSFVNQNKKGGGISTVKYSTIQPFSGISSQSVAGVNPQPPVVLPSNSVATVALGQPITLKKLDDNERGSNTELLLTISQPREPIKVEQSPEIPQPDSSTSLSSDAIEVKIEESSQSDSSSNEVFNTIQKTNSVATSVIASVVKKEEEEERSENSTAIDTSVVKVEEPNTHVERIGSVLVNASTSNGPMLSHTNSKYRKPPENIASTTAPTKEFNQNVGKAPPPGTKIFKNNAVYYAIRTKKTAGKKIDSEMQKQAAMEREMRLQKSLSEECEDLGVDEPSTSDLFPEADLLFDSNHSPSYDQTGQRIQMAEVKSKASMNLFSDDENSGPMRNDLFDYVEYHPPEAGVDQINGNNASNESASSCDDTTLLPNCGTMSEVTLNSPISPEYADNTHAANKYKYKYTNRKRGDKAVRSQTEHWSEVTEVTSTEDTIEIAKEEQTPIAIQEETVIDESVTEVETMVEDKMSPEKDFALKCLVHGSTDTRGSRKNTKKPCSCFNGSKSPTPSTAKRRLGSPKCQTPTPSKKPLLSKKR